MYKIRVGSGGLISSQNIQPVPGLFFCRVKNSTRVQPTHKSGRVGLVFFGWVGSGLSDPVARDQVYFGVVNSGRG